jgi:hypothetical protein
MDKIYFRSIMQVLSSFNYEDIYPLFHSAKPEKQIVPKIQNATINDKTFFKKFLKSLRWSLARSTSEPVVGYAKRRPSTSLGKFDASMGKGLPYIIAVP